jgi:hypothetical protein
MPDQAQTARSLSTIKTELEYLAASGLLSTPQLESIMAQLPVRITSPTFLIMALYIIGNKDGKTWLEMHAILM